MKVIKKYSLFILVSGLLVSCSGGTTESEEVQETSADQLETVEIPVQVLDSTLESTDKLMDSLQVEIDSLLNEI